MLFVLTLLPALVSFLVCGWMVRKGPLDAPDGGRKVQAAPVPNAGGVGITAGVVIALVAAWLLLGRPAFNPAYLIVLIGGAVIGYVDDWKGLSVRVKMSMLAALSILCALIGPQIVSFDVPFMEAPVVMPAVIGWAGAALWLFVMLNAVNFMDGANGIAMGSTGVMLAGAALLASSAALNGLSLGAESFAAGIAGLSAIIGFLIWNLRGKLYAGDTGAFAMGGLFAVAGLDLAAHWTVWAPALLALPFLIDVLLTIVWRARRGERVFDAHRSHAYQLLLRDGWSHLRVAALWWAFSLACVVLAYLASGRMAFVLFALALVVGIAAWIRQRADFTKRALNSRG